MRRPRLRDDANRAGLMRLVIAILLVVLGANAAVDGRWLSAGASIAFGALAGMLAYGTLPAARPLPRPLLAGALVAGVLLWILSVVLPGV